MQITRTRRPRLLPLSYNFFLSDDPSVSTVPTGTTPSTATSATSATPTTALPATTTLATTAPVSSCGPQPPEDPNKSIWGPNWKCCPNTNQWIQYMVQDTILGGDPCYPSSGASAGSQTVSANLYATAPVPSSITPTTPAPLTFTPAPFTPTPMSFTMPMISPFAPRPATKPAPKKKSVISMPSTNTVVILSLGLGAALAVLFLKSRMSR